MYDWNIGLDAIEAPPPLLAFKEYDLGPFTLEHNSNPFGNIYREGPSIDQLAVHAANLESRTIPLSPISLQFLPQPKCVEKKKRFQVTFDATASIPLKSRAYSVTKRVRTNYDQDEGIINIRDPSSFEPQLSPQWPLSPVSSDHRIKSFSPQPLRTPISIPTPAGLYHPEPRLLKRRTATSVLFGPSPGTTRQMFLQPYTESSGNDLTLRDDLLPLMRVNRMSGISPGVSTEIDSEFDFSTRETPTEITPLPDVTGISTPLSLPPNKTKSRFLRIKTIAQNVVQMSC